MKRADYLLYYPSNQAIAVIEAKDNNHSVGAGIQQALAFWVSPKDMKLDYIDSSQDYISEQGLSNSSTKLVPEGSILMVIRAMILAHFLGGCGGLLKKVQDVSQGSLKIKITLLVSPEES